MIQSILGNLKCQIKMQLGSNYDVAISYHDDHFQICSDHSYLDFSRIKNGHVRIIIQKLPGLSTPGRARLGAGKCSFKSPDINHRKLLNSLIIATAQSSEVLEKLIC